LQNQGNLILHQADSVLSLNKLELLDASSTTIVLNTDGDVKVFSLSSLLVQDGAAVTLQSTGTLPLELSEDGTMVLGQVESADLGADNQVPLTLGSGTVFQGIDAAWLSVENGLLLFNAWRDETNLYETVAASANASTGAQMLWRIPNEVLRESPDLRKLTETLDILAAEGNARTADQVLAAAAGAGTAALGTALVGDVERQLQSIRNRTTSMGVNPAMEHDFPLFNAWVNAEGDRSELDASGTEAGYSLSSWGGTVGFDVDVNDYLTAGMAFSAMYGDYESKSPDHAKGDIDTCYLSLFGRYAARRWTHTLVGTIGWADVELKRSVDYGAGSYSTSGSSDGLGFGMLYELGYVIPLDEDSSSCLQPIVNISYRHAGIDAYNESGSDAGLHVGRQDMDVVTFGLGARAQTYAMEDVYNRRCLLEARVLFKLDAGDVRSHSNVSLLADRARGGRVRSAEMGRFGVEMGAGMTIPIGVDTGSLFMDAGVGLRSRAYEVNGTVGYRLSF
jgi:outer membrane autotransporter protein